MNIKAIYERMSPGRENALTRAEQAARLTITTIEPRGTALTGDIAYSMEGADALQTLSSLVLQVLMPANQRWHRLKVPDEVLAQVAASNPSVPPEALQAGVEQAMVAAENKVRDYLTSQRVKARLAWAIKRNFVEGSTVLRFMRNAVSVIPLRNAVQKRHSGEVLWFIVEEEVAPGPSETGSIDERLPKVYTLVDYVNNAVWQQGESAENATKIEGDGADPRQWVLFSAMTGDIGDYPEPFAYFYRTLFNEMDGLITDLSRISAAAAWVVGAVNPGSTITPQQLARTKSGEIQFFNAGDVGFITTGIKVSDAGLVAARLNDLRQRKDRIFGGGVRDRAPGDRTATEVLRMIEELEQNTADLLSNYDETLMHPMIRAAMIAQGIDVRMPDGKEPIEIVITTGQSALQRQVAVGRMIQAALMVQELDPALFNRAAAFRKVAEVEGFEAEADAILTPEQPPLPVPGAEGAETGMDAPVGSTADTAGGPQPAVPAAARSMQTDGRRGQMRVA